MTSVFVSPDWLADNRERATIVDVRDPWRYEEGHLPGAINVPFQDVRDPTDAAPGKLPTSEAFESVLSEAGISREDRIVAYDGEFGVYASRFLVTAEVFGHDTGLCHLLDGDYDAWRETGEPTTDAPTVDRTDYVAERIADGPIITAESLERALERDGVIVDTRDRLEYDTVHVPGAVNFDWRALVDEEERRLEPLPRCREILADHGIELDRPVRLYCNTARRLSFVYVVLRELGHEDVGFYEGGIDAWATYGGPVETSS